MECAKACRESKRSEQKKAALEKDAEMEV